LNVSRARISNQLMSQLKLLNAPARRLLLTFVMTAGMTVATHASSPKVSLRPLNGHRPAAAAQSRVRQRIDYSQIVGVQRWGINE
jgi:hypothetical protein